MASKRDYYEVLGVARSATDREISAAYRKLAIKYHPDKNPGDDEAIEQFKEAAEAFEVLSDRDKRTRYDRYGHAGVDSPGGGAHFSDIGDIFEAFGGIFGDLFGGGSRRRRVRKGADIHCEVSIDLIQAAKGATRTLRFDRHFPCDDCGGSGARPGTTTETCNYCGGRGQVVQASGILRVQTTCPACRGEGRTIKDPCRTCRGSGFAPRQVECEVQIPAGMDNGMQIRLSGEGEPSGEGGPSGDCYCEVHVAEHPLFQRDGQHLICRIPISYSQAALGATLEVPTLDGPHKLDVPPGTQPGHVFTLRNRGMADPRRRGVGDLLVIVSIDVPQRLDAKQEQLLRQLAELEHANVTPHRKSFFEKLKTYFTGDDQQQPQPHDVEVENSP